MRASLQQLAADVTAAVSSFAGLTVVVQVGDRRVELTTVDARGPDTVKTSLRIPLRNGESALLILYSTTPGAFVDLAADIGWVTGLPPEALALDDDVAGAGDRMTTDLVAASAIDQAVGVLVAGGLTLEEAYAAIATRARAGGQDEAAVARRILDGLGSG